MRAIRQSLSHRASPPRGVARAEVVVERAGGPPEAQEVVLPAEASSRDVRHQLESLLPPPRRDGDGRAERIAAEQHRCSPDHLHGLGIVQRDEVEVHLLHGRLVDADAVEEHAHPLREPGHGRGEESAEAQVGLIRVALLVLERDSGQPLEGIGQDPRSTGRMSLSVGFERAGNVGARQGLGERNRGRDPDGGSLVSGGSRGGKATAERRPRTSSRGAPSRPPPRGSREMRFPMGSPRVGRTDAPGGRVTGGE